MKHVKNLDVIVIGAGVAGMSAAIGLSRTGVSVTIVEARDRIGGRVFTLLDPKLNVPVELGAEFIHGRPREILDLLEPRKIPITEVDGDTWCVEDGRLSPCDFFSDIDKILQKMKSQTGKEDQSFSEFLAEHDVELGHSPESERAKKWTTSYVSGFNAADPALVSVKWLVEGMLAEEKIEGDRAFHSPHGYTDLIEIFRKLLQDNNIDVQTNTVVETVQWSSGGVEVSAICPNGTAKLSAACALITVPLGVLQAREDENGAIRFNPELPSEKQDAIRNIMMGKVIRVTLRFRERFWDDLPKYREKNSRSMSDMSFLLSHDDWFPTWWTTAPKKLPIVVGWAPFHCAMRLSGQSEDYVVQQSIQALHRLLGVSTEELNRFLEHAYFHDWQSDPFARGAYSYGKAGYSVAQQALAAPVGNTLFFAGEATDIAGHNGTVHGAIASGLRAVREIIQQ
jgi:monoamine oxidase